MFLAQRARASWTELTCKLESQSEHICRCENKHTDWSVRTPYDAALAPAGLGQCRTGPGVRRPRHLRPAAIRRLSLQSLCVVLRSGRLAGGEAAPWQSSQHFAAGRAAATAVQVAFGRTAFAARPFSPLAARSGPQLVRCGRGECLQGRRVGQTTLAQEGPFVLVLLESLCHGVDFRRAGHFCRHFLPRHS